MRNKNKKRKYNEVILPKKFVWGDWTDIMIGGIPPNTGQHEKADQ